MRSPEDIARDAQEEKRRFRRGEKSKEEGAKANGPDYGARTQDKSDHGTSLRLTYGYDGGPKVPRKNNFTVEA